MTEFENLPEWMRREETEEETQKDIAEGRRCESLAIAERGIREAMQHRKDFLCEERHVLGMDLLEGDWMEEFIETDRTMGALAAAKKILEDCRYSD